MIIFGTDRDNYLKGLNASGDTIYGLGGNDTINALNGDDFLYGGNGADKIYGNGGNDVIWGGLGDDLINGGAGIDTASYSDMTSAVTVDLAITRAQYTGLAGRDTLVSIENLIGGTANDTLRGNSLANVLSGLDGNDVLDGRAGSDTLNGGDGADTLLGGDGNDSFTTEGQTVSNDVVDGGLGNDTIDYSALNISVGVHGVNVDLRLTAAQDTFSAGFDTISNVENIVGSIGHDILNGNDAANVLIGGAGTDLLAGNGGDDVLTGGSGNDRMEGGAGNDVLNNGIVDGAVFENDYFNGGGGADRFVFENAATSDASFSDVIEDFSTLEGDKLDLHGLFAAGQTASFVGFGALTGVAGQIQLIRGFVDFGMPGVSQKVAVDLNGDGIRDFAVQVNSNVYLSLTDMIV